MRLLVVAALVAYWSSSGGHARSIVDGVRHPRNTEYLNQYLQKQQLQQQFANFFPASSAVEVEEEYPVGEVVTGVDVSASSLALSAITDVFSSLEECVTEKLQTLEQLALLNSIITAVEEQDAANYGNDKSAYLLEQFQYRTPELAGRGYGLGDLASLLGVLGALGGGKGGSPLDGLAIAGRAGKKELDREEIDAFIQSFINQNANSDSVYNVNGGLIEDSSINFIQSSNNLNGPLYNNKNQQYLKQQKDQLALSNSIGLLGGASFADSANNYPKVSSNIFGKNPILQNQILKNLKKKKNGYGNINADVAENIALFGAALSDGETNSNILSNYNNKLDKLVPQNYQKKQSLPAAKAQAIEKVLAILGNSKNTNNNYNVLSNGITNKNNAQYGGGLGGLEGLDFTKFQSDTGYGGNTFVESLNPKRTNFNNNQKEEVVVVEKEEIIGRAHGEGHSGGHSGGHQGRQHGIEEIVVGPVRGEIFEEIFLPRAHGEGHSGGHSGGHQGRFKENHHRREGEKVEEIIEEEIVVGRAHGEGHSGGHHGRALGSADDYSIYSPYATDTSATQSLYSPYGTKLQQISPYAAALVAQYLQQQQQSSSSDNYAPTTTYAAQTDYAQQY